jgi:hypothetical protein
MSSCAACLSPVIPLYADRLPYFRKFSADDVAKAYQIVNPSTDYDHWWRSTGNASR